MQRHLAVKCARIGFQTITSSPTSPRAYTQFGITFIPGYGALLGAPDALAYLSVIRKILDVVAVAVREEVFTQGNIPPNDTEQLQRGHFIAVKDAVKKRPDILVVRERFGRGDADRLAFFDSAMPNVIDAAYRETWGN
jgi:hypothetical protein